MSRFADSNLPALVLGASLAACGSGGETGAADAGTEDASSFDAVAVDSQSGTLVVTLDAATRATIVYGDCAALDTFVVAPQEATVGHPIQLDASGFAPGSTRSDVVITWAAVGSAGTLAATAGSSNVFDCTSPGSSTITVTASIGDGGAPCKNSGSLSVVVSCD